MNDPTRYVRGILGVVSLVAVLLLLARCDLTEPVEERRLVVEAFFLSEQPLGPITLRTTQPLGDTAADPATNAEVTLDLDGERVAYHPVEGRPGRYAPDTAMTVPAHAAFTLTARWQGQKATASGMVPPPITIEEAQVTVPETAIEAILVDSLRRDSLDIPAEQGFIYPVEVTVSWNAEVPAAEPDSTYWVRTQLDYAQFSSTVVDFFLQPEEVFREDTAPQHGRQRRWTGVYAVPVEHADDPMPPHELRVALVRGGSAYAEFATSRNDPERREPISNVRGGIGVAAAVALDSIRVEVGAAERAP